MGTVDSVTIWGLRAESRVPPVMVVVMFPIADDDTSLRQRPETVGIQTLIADAELKDST